MTEHIINSLNPRSPGSDNVQAAMHRDPVPGEPPVPADPPIPGEPPTPTDPPVVPPSPVAEQDGQKVPPQPAGNKIMPSDSPDKGLNSYMDE